MFTLKTIDTDKKTITVSFDVDNLDQTMACDCYDNAQALNDFLFKYETAYVSGLAISAPPIIAPDVKALIGKPTEAVALEVTALVGQSMSLEQVDVKGVKTLQSSVSLKATPALGKVTG